ncbi:hypothetical protein C8R44DRAFT_991907 [Mycena epipterygia]|nr:hypothetical protein C8R44DRAFT_991907 [Mycena epipterygia]
MAAAPKIVEAAPTLLLVPSFSYSGTPSAPSAPNPGAGALALLPVPPAANSALASIIQSASAGDVNGVRAHVLAAAGSLDDDDYDPDLEDFLSPAPPPLEPAPSSQPGEKGKGKAGAPPPPRVPPPPPPVDTNGVPTAPSTPVASGAAHPSTPVASGSGSVHPFCKAVGFTPGEAKTPGKRWEKKDHELTRAHVDGLLAASTQLDDRVFHLSSDLSEMGESMQNQILELRDMVSSHTGTVGGPLSASDIAAIVQRVDIAAIVQRVQTQVQSRDFTAADIDTIAEQVHARDGHTMRELVRASNKHGSNSSNAASAIDDLSSRLNALENTAADQVGRISELESTVAAQASTIARLSARRVASAPAPHVENVQTLRYINDNSKHPREDEIDDATRIVRPRVEQAAFVADPAPVVYAAPAPAPAVVHAPAPTAAPFPGHTATAAPFPGHAAAAPAPVAAPAPAPRKPFDAACEVLIGPVTWNVSGDGKTTVKTDVSNLIREIIPTAPARITFRTRRSNPHPASYTICTFDTSAIADWVVDSWASLNHGPYSSITATSMLPKV